MTKEEINNLAALRTQEHELEKEYQQRKGYLAKQISLWQEKCDHLYSDGKCAWNNNFVASFCEICGESDW